MSGSLPPGWYPAPWSSDVQRWWDGIRWTGEVREADNAGGADAAVRTSPTGPAAGPAGGAEPDGAPEAQAAWRAQAVEAWEARTTAPEQSRRLAWWLGRTRHR